MINKNTIKKITKVFLVIYIIFSSGIVLFSYECNENKHIHFGIMKKATCNNTCNCNCNHKHHNETTSLKDNIEQQHFKEKVHNYNNIETINSFSGINKIKVLKNNTDFIKISNNILKNLLLNIEVISIIKLFNFIIDLNNIEIIEYKNYSPPLLIFLYHTIKYIHNYSIIPLNLQLN